MLRALDVWSEIVQWFGSHSQLQAPYVFLLHHFFHPPLICCGQLNVLLLPDADFQLVL